MSRDDDDWVDRVPWGRIALSAASAAASLFAFYWLARLWVDSGGAP